MDDFVCRSLDKEACESVTRSDVEKSMDDVCDSLMFASVEKSGIEFVIGAEVRTVMSIGR